MLRSAKAAAKVAAVILLMIAVYLTMGVPACALGSVSVNAPENIDQGRVFTVELLINSSEVSAVFLRVKYDGAIKFNSAKFTSDGRMRTSEEKASVQLICYFDDDFSGGKIAELSFSSERGETRSADIEVEIVSAVDKNGEYTELGGGKCSVGIGSNAASSSGGGARSGASASMTSTSKESSNKASSSRASSSKTASRKNSSAGRTSSVGNDNEDYAAKDTFDTIYLGSAQSGKDRLYYAAGGALLAAGVIGFAWFFYKLGASSGTKNN